MNRNAFLVFVAVVSIIYGIGNLLMPAWVNEMHGLTSSPGTSLVSRYLGASLLGLGVMSWFNRDAADSDASGFMRGGLVVAVAGLIVSVQAMMAGLMSTMGWVTVIVQALLALGFMYFAIMKR